MDRYLAANRALWDEWTAIHVRSQFYDVEGWKDGHDTVGLRPFVREEVGDVDYWPSSEPLEFPTAGSYADPDADVEQPFEYYWQHSMGEIVSALAGAGLRIDFIHEYAFAVWQMYPFLVETEPRTWRLPAPLDGRLPLTFSLKATKT